MGKRLASGQRSRETVCERISFEDFLAAFGAETPFADEKYAAPLDKDLLIRFYRKQVPPITAEFVFDQVRFFKSWRDAFVAIVQEETVDRNR